jgi:hypothetical protein
MPRTDQIPARADPLPTAFGCTATHGGLDAAWVYVAGELDIARHQSSNKRCASLTRRRDCTTTTSARWLPCQIALGL